MFIDQADITIIAGRGGDGHISFHTAKYIPKGGPDGGDGGRGGDVVFAANGNMTSLRDFRYKRKYKAADGEPGGGGKCSGKSAPPLRIEVPVGTVLYDRATGRVLADMNEPGMEKVIAKGGGGGRGNARFANAIRQAPNFAKAGRVGEEFDLHIELKVLADVGLLGMPNVGKSTFLSVVSAAKPKIADYHFTTLKPNLGVCRYDDIEFVMADIPGLIPGASLGAGLGHAFLRHVERTRLLVHIVDVSGSEGRDPVGDFDAINAELKKWDVDLASRPQLVIANKIDLAEPDQVAAFRSLIEERGYPVYEMCAPIHEGTDEILKAIAEQVASLPPTVLVSAEETDHKVYEAPTTRFTIERDEAGFHVVGSWSDHLVQSTNFDDTESLQFFQRCLRREGVIEALEAAGIQEGDAVIIEELEFEFIP